MIKMTALAKTTIARKILLTHEDADDYHARSRSGEFLSSHRLAMFRKCPQLFKAGSADKDRPAYLVGRAAHMLILEGPEVFHNYYAVGGPVNKRTGRPYGVTTQAYAEWIAAVGRAGLTTDQYDLCARMADSVQHHELANKLLKSGIPEAVVRAEYNGIKSQARIDWVSPQTPRIVDLKTCDDLNWFEADSRRFGYANQLAFYRSVFAEAADINPATIEIVLIAVEKQEPYRCGVWNVADEMLRLAQLENDDAMHKLARCFETNNWPTGYEDARTFTA